jgi:hypothetical protein
LRDKRTIDQFDFDHHPSRKEQKTASWSCSTSTSSRPIAMSFSLATRGRAKPSWPHAWRMPHVTPISRCSLPRPWT